MAEIKPRLKIKRQILTDCAKKAIMIELIIMLVWFSCIYKQNIFSFFLFVVLVIHTYSYKFSINTFNYVRYTVATIFITQYIIALLCLSSYNTPSKVPHQLLNYKNSTEGNFTVYPNAYQNYFAIPVYFNLSQAIHDTAPLPPSVNLAWMDFFSFFVGNK